MAPLGGSWDEWGSAPRIAAVALDALARDDHVCACVERVCDEVEAEKINVFAFNDLTRTLDCVVSPDMKGAQLHQHEGALGRAFQTGNVVNVSNVPDHNGGIDSSTGYVVKESVSAPILNDDGEPIGVVQAINKKGSASGAGFSAKDVSAVVLLSSELKCYIDEKQMSLQVEQVISHKPLRITPSPSPWQAPWVQNENGRDVEVAQPGPQSRVQPDEAAVFVDESGQVAHRMPQAASTSRSAVAAPAPLIRQSSTVNQTGLLLLVVDDVQGERRVLRHMLQKRLGHRVDEASNGQQALDMVVHSMLSGERSYDAIFLDYEMPIMNGLTALVKMKERGYAGPVYGFPSPVDDETRAFVEAGIVKVLEKPVYFKMMQTIVADIEAAARAATRGSMITSSLLPLINMAAAVTVLGGSLGSGRSKVSHRSTSSGGLGQDKSPRSTRLAFNSAPLRGPGFETTAGSAGADCSAGAAASGAGDDAGAGMAVALSGSGPGVRLRFLIVDDIRSCRRILTHTLGKRLGHVVDEAEDGAEAVRRVEAAAREGDPYDAVLMDMTMPVMDGAAASRAMRKIGYVGHIVGLTGWSEDKIAPMRQELVSLTKIMNSLQSKPLKQDEILDLIQSKFFGPPLATPPAPCAHTMLCRIDDHHNSFSFLPLPSTHFPSLRCAGE